MAWTIAWGKGGWITYNDPPGSVSVKFAESESGRLEIVNLHFRGDHAVTGEHLRTIPLGRIENLVNSPPLAAEMREHIATEAVDVEEAERTFARVIPGGVTLPRRRPKVKLNIPTSAKKPDKFYGDVAEAFAWLGLLYSNPAQELAKANDVPVTTVHRWVREARRRGLLAPARREKGA
jgi:hypothetical protein